MSPVLLLDVSIVIFLVRTAARELDLEGLAIVIEMSIDKFRAVVGVNAQQFKRQGLTDGFHGATDSFLPFAQHGTSLDPGGVDVGEVQRMTAVSGGRAAGMRDQIDFGEAGLANVPVVGLDGNVMLQQGARFGPTVDPFFELALFGAEPMAKPILGGLHHAA